MIGLDSQLTGEDAGELGSEQLAWLDDRLAVDPARSAVLFLHHPPIAVGSPWVDRIGLLDAGALESVLARHPQVRAVITGHVHQEASGRSAARRCTRHRRSAPSSDHTPKRSRSIRDRLPTASSSCIPTGDWSTTVVRCPPP